MSIPRTLVSTLVALSLGAALAQAQERPNPVKSSGPDSRGGGSSSGGDFGGGGGDRTGGFDRVGGPGGHMVGGGKVNTHIRSDDASRGGGFGHGGTTYNDSIFRTACPRLPTATYWRSRDIGAFIRALARRGPVPVSRVSEELNELSGVAIFPAGWRGYSFLVPPGGKLHVGLQHPNRGWFRLAMVNKWGNLEKGMLQNLIPTGNPEVSYINYSKEVRAVYVIVDDPGWMSSAANPYFLDIKRDWEPGKLGPNLPPQVEGIWASNPVERVSAEYRSASR